MNINILKDHSQMSVKAAQRVVTLTDRNEKMLYCFPAGESPTELIHIFASYICDNDINMHEKRFVSLDEWVGFGIGDYGSCIQYMTENLYNKIDIDEKSICFFDGLADDLEAECKRVDAFINNYGGIDIAVLGIGMNGHLGFNENGVSFDLNSHVIDLDAVTKEISSKYFDRKVNVTKGITIGINQIMQAKEVILIASGQHKAQIIKQAIEGPVTNEVPASILRRHPNAHVFLDQEAGALLGN